MTLRNVIFTWLPWLYRQKRKLLWSIDRTKMLQVYRRNQLRNGKPSVDFVSRNKRAVSQSQAINKQKNNSQTRSKFKPKVDKKINQAESANTVVVSKQYLDELLHMRVQHKDVRTESDTKTHVSLEPSQVPGLTSPLNQENNVHQTNDDDSLSSNHQAPTSKQQWLDDLAIQAREQRQRREIEKMRQKQSNPEEYFPFGRPGGGAPIKSQSGQLLTNYRFRSQVGGVSSPVNESLTQFNPPPINSRNNIVVTTDNSTPRFARGAGPFVDEYILQEKEEKRKKQMEHMMFIREQVAAKEKAKMEERLRKEREEAVEEERLAKERETMKLEFQKEKEKAKQKELESLRYQALLQSRITEAEESAKQAKLAARNKHHMYDTHGHMTDHVTNVCRLAPDKFNSSLRSPSMMQLSADSAMTLSFGHSTSESTSDKTNQRVSRIPVLTTNSIIGKAQRTVPSQRVVPSQRTIPEKQPPVRTVRVVSPPVPALAKKVNTHQLLLKSPPPVPTVVKKLALSKLDATSNTACTHIEMTSRPKSPPVPALAKKMGLSKSRSSNNKPFNETIDGSLQNGHTHSHDEQYPINRPPSCSLVVVPDPSPHTSPITIETNDESQDLWQTLRSTSRQQLILQELATLRESILSQRSTVDSRVDRILTRKKCTF